MRSLPGLTLIIILAISVGSCGGQMDPAADYLGQKLPSDIPVRFAPGLVSTNHHEHSRIVFSPDGTELYWAVIPVGSNIQPENGNPFLPDQQNIWFTHKSSAGWSEPLVLPITESSTASSPVLSADGSTLYFKTRDPQADPDERPRPGIIYGTSKENGEWTNPVIVSNILPTEKGTVSTSFCFADNGNLYFDVGGPDETGQWRWRMYVSKFKNGQYDKPQLLPNGINDGDINWCPWIAPDESYILWSSHREGEAGGGDLYVSFHQPDSSWSVPLNLGENINTPNQERFPSVSPDGRYLFFSRHVDNETYSDIYWVSTHNFENVFQLSHSMENNHRLSP